MYYPYPQKGILQLRLYNSLHKEWHSACFEISILLREVIEYDDYTEVKPRFRHYNYNYLAQSITLSCQFHHSFHFIIDWVSTNIVHFLLSDVCRNCDVWVVHMATTLSDLSFSYCLLVYHLGSTVVALHQLRGYSSSWGTSGPFA